MTKLGLARKGGWAQALKSNVLIGPATCHFVENHAAVVAKVDADMILNIQQYLIKRILQKSVVWNY